jgi:hypothetical protein
MSTRTLVVCSLWATALLFSASGGAAEIYKCTNAAGRVEFVDEPCSNGTKGAAIEVKPNTLDTSADRAAVARAQSQTSRDKAPTGATPQKQAAAAPKATIDPAACSAAESEYESIASTAGAAPADLAAKAAAAHTACGTSNARHVIGAQGLSTNVNGNSAR